jgi:hypothetical protein
VSKPLLSSPSASYRHKCAVEAAAIAAEAAAAAQECIILSPSIPMDGHVT